MRIPALVLAAGTVSFAFGAVMPGPLEPEAAAQAFVTSLDAAQRARAVLPFEHPARRDWHYFPRDRAGLPLRDMQDAQRRAAHALLRSGLSTSGYLKASGIFSLEGVLAEIERNPGRDPGLYTLAVFGEPGSEPWGWRVEGHHVSFNFTFAGGAATATPAFLGASPAEVGGGSLAGWRVLAGEEDLGRELARSLREDQAKRARIADQAPAEIQFGPGVAPAFAQPAGLPATALTAAQSALLRRLLDAYLDNLAPQVAAAAATRVEAEAAQLHFAWAGGLEPGQGHYYRITGASFLIEYCNTQNGANHVHTCWRERGEFGGESRP